MVTKQPKRVSIVSRTYGTSIAHGQADSKNIDWHNSSDRKWLMSHLHWAMNNRTIVTFTPFD